MAKKEKDPSDVVMRVLSQPMTRAMQLQAIADELEVNRAKAARLLADGRRWLRQTRIDIDDERHEQLQRLRRASAQALVGGKLSAFAAIESLYSDVAGTKQPRKTEITGANGGAVEIRTWADLAKLGEAALKERGNK